MTRIIVKAMAKRRMKRDLVREEDEEARMAEKVRL